jgi:hypothetical protein
MVLREISSASPGYVTWLLTSVADYLAMLLCWYLIPMKWLMASMGSLLMRHSLMTLIPVATSTTILTTVHVVVAMVSGPTGSTLIRSEVSM